jgi:RNA polymerase sigma-70 factor (ECF subfamily)
MPFDKAQGMEEERGWVREALAGDQEAFARLVENYQAAVYNLAYRMLGNAGDAEDAAQETFLRAYSRLRSYDPARKFSSWLLAIAAHHCVDRLRRRRWTISLEDTPLGRKLSTGRDPEREMERKEEREEIRRLLERLPPHYRLVVILYYWNDLSCRQIGEVMGLGGERIRLPSFERGYRGSIDGASRGTYPRIFGWGTGRGREAVARGAPGGLRSVWG